MGYNIDLISDEEIIQVIRDTAKKINERIMKLPESEKILNLITDLAVEQTITASFMITNDLTSQYEKHRDKMKNRKFIIK